MGQISSEEDTSDRRISDTFGSEPQPMSAEDKRDAYRKLVRSLQDDSKPADFIQTLFGPIPRPNENVKWQARLHLRLRLMKERLARR